MNKKMGGSNLTLYMKGDLTIYVYKKEKCDMSRAE